MEVLMVKYLSLTSISSGILAILLIAYAVSVIRKNPVHWGKPLSVLIFSGLLLCILVALRDGYGFSSDSVIAFTGWQSTLFSLCGVSILLIGLTALFSKRFSKRPLFISVFAIFMFKLILMETFRFMAFMSEVL
jgi:hypothetical protein